MSINISFKLQIQIGFIQLKRKRNEYANKHYDTTFILVRKQSKNGY